MKKIFAFMMLVLIVLMTSCASKQKVTKSEAEELYGRFAELVSKEEAWADSAIFAYGHNSLVRRDGNAIVTG